MTDGRSTNGPAPDRTLEQRLAALEEANTVRTTRADLKRRLKRDRRILALAIELDTDALGVRPHDLDTMRVYDLLVSAPKIGRVKANRILTVNRISPSKTLGGLSERQRGELLNSIAPVPAPAQPRGTFYPAPMGGRLA